MENKKRKYGEKNKKSKKQNKNSKEENKKRKNGEEENKNSEEENKKRKNSEKENKNSEKENKNSKEENKNSEKENKNIEEKNKDSEKENKNSKEENKKRKNSEEENINVYFNLKHLCYILVKDKTILKEDEPQVVYQFSNDLIHCFNKDKPIDFSLFQRLKNFYLITDDKQQVLINTKMIRAIYQIETINETIYTKITMHDKEINCLMTREQFERLLKKINYSVVQVDKSQLINCF